MSVIGLSDVVAALEHLKKRYQEAMAAAIYQEACVVMAASIQECPVDGGDLRRSHYVAPATNLEDPVVMVGYGMNYGIYVHERTDLHHNAPTKDHFLSDPMTAAVSGYSERLSKRIQENLAAGVDRGKAQQAYPKKPGGGTSAHGVTSGGTESAGGTSGGKTPRTHQYTSRTVDKNGKYRYTYGPKK